MKTDINLLKNSLLFVLLYRLLQSPEISNLIKQIFVIFLSKLFFYK